MGIITIDLGTTNIKTAAYTDAATPLGIVSYPVTYDRHDMIVEFDAETYVTHILTLIKECHEKFFSANEQIQIVLTGQAESLVLLGENGKPLCPAISWLDMRSVKECEELSAAFPATRCYEITGQPKIIPTWPITKILWLKKNMPELFSRVYKFLLLKDYIQYCLTGKIAGEYSIYPFSHYFDIHKKNYWTDILEYCGVRLCQLPELVEPCTDLGPVLPAICQYTHLPESSSVNAGTLDHFAGMIGTGNLHEGLISESAGTVSSIATFVSNPAASPLKAPLYVGPFKDSYIYLPVCESGGLCLEWFKQNIITDTSYEAINTETAKRSMDNSLIFLPYITGVNPPDFNPNATGVFYGLHASHDKFDMTLAIMCGVAFLLRKNIDSFNAAGIKVDHIISTGGGARSPLWCQLKADITNVPVVIPENEESSSMGCALIGAVTNNIYPDYEAAVNHCIKMKQTFFPNPNRTIYEKKYHLFHTLYETLTPVFNEKT